MRTALLLSLLFLGDGLSAQEATEKKQFFDVFVGARARTTIYPKPPPSSVLMPSLNAFEQPGMHLDGYGFRISERIKLSRGWSANLHQTIRFDYLYQRFSLERVPPPGFQYTIEKRFIYDLYADLSKELPSKHSSFFRLLVGSSISGLNTGYKLTRRFYQTPTNYTDITTQNNFIFPTITAGIGWQWKKLNTELKVGYCWNDPTFLDTPFLSPEISCQYKLFSLFKKEKK